MTGDEKGTSNSDSLPGHRDLDADSMSESTDEQVTGLSTPAEWQKQDESHVGDENPRKGDADVEAASLEPPSPIDPQPQLSRAKIILLVATVTGAAFLNTFSVQSAVIILPTIGRALDIPSARQQWLVSAYSLTFGCFLLICGRLADVYPKRNMFIVGSAWVCLCTVVCPFIPNEIGFDIFRGLQGLGAAANVPTAIGILGITLPPGKAKTYAFAVYGAGAPIGSVLGNIFGGVVGQYAGWKWVFWILSILAAGVTVSGYFFIPVRVVQLPPQKLRRRVDWIGGSIVTIALLLLLIALTEGNILGWTTPWIPTFIGLFGVLMAVFIYWEIYLERTGRWRPLTKMSLFRDRKLSASFIIMGLMFSSFNGLLIFTTYFFQDYQGHSPIMTAVRFIPTGVVGTCTVFFLSQLLARVQVHFILMGGMLCVTLASLLFAIPFDPTVIYWAYEFPALVLSVLGVDTVFTSLLLFVSRSLPQEDQAMGGAIINAVAQVGRSLGLAIATAIQVAVQESKGNANLAKSTAPSLHNASFLSGLRAANWFDMAQAATGLFVAAWAFRGAGKVAKR